MKKRVFFGNSPMYTWTFVQIIFFQMLPILAIVVAGITPKENLTMLQGKKYKKNYQMAKNNIFIDGIKNK